MQPAPSMSIVTLFLNADVVVKGVLLLLLAASVWSWAVIVDKILNVGAASRSLRAHEVRAAAARAPADLLSGSAKARDPAGPVLVAGFQESAIEVPASLESLGERRARIERAMRLALNSEMRRLETNLPFLATIGSAAPFIGLFGTVWGIMRSFAGIAAANNTSLAVVAPGIAEALFATAIGLVAAIPAVIAYNKFTADSGRSRPHARADRTASGGRRWPRRRRVERWPWHRARSAMTRRRRGPAQPIAEINVTPLVDVMLVLLIIFMVTAPLLTAGVPLDLPKTIAAQLTQPKEPVVLSLDRDGGTFIGDERVEPGDLKERLTRLAAEDPDRIVYVRGDRTILYARLMEALGIVSSAGFTKVSLVAEAAQPK